MRVHISLNVKALDQSIAFYSRLFGREASKLRIGYANFRLDEPPIHLALVESGSTPVSGPTHFGIELPDAGTLAGWQKRLEDAGASLNVEDNAACCYAHADKLWLTDPDGYRWEVWFRTGEHDAMGETRIPVEADNLTASCCAT